MNKTELTRVVAGKLGMTNAKAAECIEVVLGSCVDSAFSEGKVVFSPFKFFRKDRPARMGINPRTQERIEIGPSSTIKFKVIGQ